MEWIIGVIILVVVFIAYEVVARFLGFPTLFGRSSKEWKIYKRYMRGRPETGYVDFPSWCNQVYKIVRKDSELRTKHAQGLITAEEFKKELKSHEEQLGKLGVKHEDILTGWEQFPKETFG